MREHKVLVYFPGRPQPKEQPMFEIHGTPPGESAERLVARRHTAVQAELYAANLRGFGYRGVRVAAQPGPAAPVMPQAPEGPPVLTALPLVDEED